MRRRPSIIQAVVGCTALRASAPVATPPYSGTDGLRIATFGTSLTANGGWQEPAADVFGGCLGRPGEVSSRGRAGTASDGGVEAVGDVAATRPDIVFIEFGANDAALNKLIGPSTSTANMRWIVDALSTR